MLLKKKIPSPIGPLTIVASDSGVHVISFAAQEKLPASSASAVESQNHPILVQCAHELKEYFQGMRSTFSVPLNPSGTEFQKKVWSALIQIPFGTTVSYSQQADQMGRKSSVRAVAAANGRNPIAIIIPCHRVIASTGHLHGYAGGLELKRKLLEIEGLKINNLQVEMRINRNKKYK